MTVQIITADCREALRAMADESVHCVVTSPPYWGLRSYGVDDAMGLEATLDEHIDGMVQVFREVRRVLRKDGVAWVNYGDCYTGSNNTNVGGNANWGSQPGRDVQLNREKRVEGLKPKDLCMVPARIALALQADGWWLRSEIVWAKPNPMPESVTDRPTSAHEKVYLLAKSAKYFYDAEAVREPHTRIWDASNGGNLSPTGDHKANGKYRERGGTYPLPNPSGRNLRNVWNIATAPFPSAHFATFPPALIEPCIKAGTSEHGVCGECGAPWVREVERTAMETRDGPKSVACREQNRTAASGTMTKAPTSKTIGWSPSCNCHADTHLGQHAIIIPATVLDPFGGAGTTGLVADRLGRFAILIEINPEYAAMARKRIDTDAATRGRGPAEMMRGDGLPLFANAHQRPVYGQEGET